MSARSSLLGDIISTLTFASVIPGILYTLYLNNIIVWNTFKISLLLFFVIFFIGPLIFKFSYSFQRQVIFLNYVNWPKNPKYDHPEYYGLNGTRNLYLNTDSDVTVGIWHILPEDLIKENAHEEYYENSLTKGYPIFLYMHGNSGNRAADHRIQLYKVLRKHYHVIALDYRSYGDSSNVPPTENGVVKDAIALIKWIKNITNDNIFIWGHSLGTGISTHALHLLSLENISVNGLVLESPFTSIREEVAEHPSAWLFRDLPWFTYTVVNALHKSGFRFETTEHILYVRCPILILHADDDLVVPYKLGLNLYLYTRDRRPKDQGQVYLKSYPGKFGYGHKFICRVPDLNETIGEFVEQCKKFH